MNEQRKYVRFKAPFSFKFDLESSPSQKEGVVKDVSMGGLRVALSGEFPLPDMGSTAFYLFLPNSILKVSGEIVWKKDYAESKEIGVRFSNIADSYKEEIYSYIFKHHNKELTRRWWDSLS